MVKPLTSKQQQVLQFIKSFLTKQDIAPTLQNIADFLKTTNLSTAQYYVQSLQKKGYLEKIANCARGLRPLDMDKPIQEMSSVPLLGIIAAGHPIEPIEATQTIPVPTTMKLNLTSSYYALTVKGDSMIDMGILDGDVVLIKHQWTAQDGEVIVAVTEQGATLKMLRKRLGKIWLEARNPNYEPIYPKHLEIRECF